MMVFIGECGKWGASISVFGYTSASRPFNEVASIGLSWYTNANLLFLPCHQPFLCFSNFWFNLRVAFWRHFWALFPTNWLSSFQWSWPCSIWSNDRWDIVLRREVTQNWRILDVFSWKIHIFQLEVDIVDPFLWN